MRLGDWTQRNGGRGEDLQLAFLFSSSEWPVFSKGVLAGLVGP